MSLPLLVVLAMIIWDAWCWQTAHDCPCFAAYWMNVVTPLWYHCDNVVTASSESRHRAKMTIELTCNGKSPKERSFTQFHFAVCHLKLWSFFGLKISAGWAFKAPQVSSKISSFHKRYVCFPTLKGTDGYLYIRRVSFPALKFPSAVGLWNHLGTWESWESHPIRSCQPPAPGRSGTFWDWFWPIGLLWRVLKAARPFVITGNCLETVEPLVQQQIETVTKADLPTEWLKWAQVMTSWSAKEQLTFGQPLLCSVPDMLNTKESC